MNSEPTRVLQTHLVMDATAVSHFVEVWAKEARAATVGWSCTPTPVGDEEELALRPTVFDDIGACKCRGRRHLGPCSTICLIITDPPIHSTASSPEAAALSADPSVWDYARDLVNIVRQTTVLTYM